MSLDLAQLRAELLGDPATLGYPALVTAGNHAGLAALLNDASKGGTLNLAEAPADLLRCVVAPSEYLNLTANERTYLNFLLGGATVYLTTTVKQWVNGLGAGFATSKAAMAARFTRPGSRGELLFGEGTQVQVAEVAAALNP